MGSKFQKNAIITGYVNSYCLVCESCFDTVDETNAHIQEDTHADRLTAHPYLEKYGDNHIRKVNKGYFCEFCSLLLATAARVSLHVQDKSHYEKKGTFLLRRTSRVSAVVAFEDILIDERAWHSLSEETCAICNEEFPNESIHKAESGHLLKLVQNKVKFGTDNNVYRMTDDSSFQCLTCNSVFAVETLNEHFTDSEHKKLYAKCQDKLKQYLEQSKASDKSTKLDVNEDTEKSTKDSKDKITSDMEEEIDKNHNNITDNSVAKEESKANGIEPKEVKKDMKPGCKVMALKTEEPPVESETSIYANGNNLTYNEGNTNAFCRICETKLPATLRSMKEHVNGKEHKSRLAKANQAIQTAKAKSSITKRTMKQFIDYVFRIKTILYDDVIVDEKYCMSIVSFVMITKNGTKYRCQACEVNMSEDNIDMHANTPRHERAMDHTPVVTSLPADEFVREVRFDIFHCGFCNLIIPRWEEVGSHLHSKEHQENKDACAWRLRRHLPAVLRHRRAQELDTDFMRMLFMRHVLRQ